MLLFGNSDQDIHYEIEFELRRKILFHNKLQQ